MFLEWSHGDATPITLYPHAGLGITCCLWHTPRPPISWSGSPVLAPADFAGFAHASQKSLQIGAGAGELNAILIMTFGVLQSAVSATGEEIGSRGFLVPALAQRLNSTVVALVSDVIWAVGTTLLSSSERTTARRQSGWLSYASRS
jgi:membrane protease YdiL (CAAX protease family)